MPGMTKNAYTPTASAALVGYDYPYEYPVGLKLKPGMQQHDKLVKIVLDRAASSFRKMSVKHPVWRDLDYVLTAFVTESTYKHYKDLIEAGKVSPKSRKLKIDKNKAMQDIEIVFPYTHTILETLLAYMLTTFVRDPIFTYAGRGGVSDIVGAKLLELIVQAHCTYSKFALALHTLFRDSFVYGFGVGALTWKEKYGTRRIVRQKSFLGFNMGTEVVGEKAMLYEGNAMFNIDPYCFLPDPNVQLHNIQEGEFVGYVKQTNYMTKLGEENASGLWFNTKYLKHTQFADRYSGNRDKELQQTDVNNPISDIHMYVTLIPSEYGLSNSKLPEKWYFCLSNESVITQAMPMGLDHDDYPFAVITPDFDGHNLLPISRMEIPYGLQTVLDWMFNAHTKNLRKAINDVFLVDPYLVNMRDVESPEAGKIIKTTKAAWGRGVKDVMQQLPVADVTRGMIGEVMSVMSYMDRATGTDAAAQGSLRSGGPDRLTSDEFKGTQRGQLNRFFRLAMIIGIQGMQDIGRMFAFNTKQFMSQEFFVNLTSDSAESLIATYGVQPLMVDPQSIMVDTDIIVHHGADTGSYNDVWMKLFEMITRDPELRQGFDTVRIFKQIATNAGATDVGQFVRMTQMMPGQMQSEVQKGNLVRADAA